MIDHQEKVIKVSPFKPLLLIAFVVTTLGSLSLLPFILLEGEWFSLLGLLFLVLICLSCAVFVEAMPSKIIANFDKNKLVDQRLFFGRWTRNMQKKTLSDFTHGQIVQRITVDSDYQKGKYHGTNRDIDYAEFDSSAESSFYLSLKGKSTFDYFGLGEANAKDEAYSELKRIMLLLDMPSEAINYKVKVHREST